MILTTERMVLRPFRESDAKALFEYAKDDRIGPIAGWPPHQSEAESLAIIRTVFSVREVYAVTLKGDDRVIGMVGLLIGQDSNFKIADNEAELAYWIGVPYWGKGLIPEASKVVIEHAFTSLNMAALWCGFYENNTQSFRAQEKCGFKIVRTEAQQYNQFMNEYRKEHISYLSKEEWLNHVKERTC
ncbi:MAG TPA: GNAT family N-acetyltransferase [Candidatus Ignatzschineria merdigallinarum]|uniref:GNAT family N-acetyltransferase n=1 Tax=Candidatus Ignatzschineria merdigallinarum TaxID=2838621 RepID=A0A9D1Q4L2_9GAMM|nr:GNAT family N-acetyltransferase [Candidatus Ignatzschineria merdigallinarum]